MIQPTKDEYRQWLSETQDELRREKFRRESLEARLELAKRALGQLVLSGKISLPLEALGELPLEAHARAERDEFIREDLKRRALLPES